jgi:tRNA nucleotidyltransferase (CCA-adding enzyme)
LPQPVYLVGGIVRDALLGRQGTYLDWDFIVPVQAIETAQAIARHYGAGFVVLDAERQIARVVFGQTTVDFALREGKTLEADLQRRDFTVNAIAYDPFQETLIDPWGGYGDLQHRCLRMIAAENLRSDPLRLLRAYRQAAQLNFNLDPVTETTIAQLSPLLRSIAAERVQTELNSLLDSPRGSFWLGSAWQAGLFQDWLPSMTAAAVEQLGQIDRAVEILVNTWPTLATTFRQPLALTAKEGYRRSGLALAKLTALLDSDPDRATDQWRQLKGSRAEVRAVGVLRRLQPLLENSELSIREQYFLFQAAQDLLPILVLLGLTTEKSGEEAVNFKANSLSFRLLQCYLNEDDLVAHPQILVTGKDLLQAFPHVSGPQVGYLLTELQIAQAEGRISTPPEALALAAELGAVQNQNSPALYEGSL